MLPLAPPPPLSPLRLILLLLLCRRPLLSLLSLPAQRQFEFVSAHFLVLSPPFRVLSFVRLSCKITCVYVTHCVLAVLQCGCIQWLCISCVTVCRCAANTTKCGRIQPNLVAYNQICISCTAASQARPRKSISTQLVRHEGRSSVNRELDARVVTTDSRSPGGHVLSDEAALKR